MARLMTAFLQRFNLHIRTHRVACDDISDLIECRITNSFSVVTFSAVNGYLLLVFGMVTDEHTHTTEVHGSLNQWIDDFMNQTSK